MGDEAIYMDIVSYIKEITKVDFFNIGCKNVTSLHSPIAEALVGIVH